MVPEESLLKSYISLFPLTIAEETQLTVPIVCVVISLIALFLMCLYQSSAVKQR